MESLKLCESEYRFMSVVWEYEPLTSERLVILCANELGWKKPTTNNVLRKLCEKGFLRNTGAVVTSLIPKEKVQYLQNEHFVKRRSRLAAGISLLLTRRSFRHVLENSTSDRHGYGADCQLPALCFIYAF